MPLAPPIPRTPRDGTPSKPLSLELPVALKAWLDEHARTRGRSTNAQVVYWLNALRQAVEAEGDPYP